MQFNDAYGAIVVYDATSRATMELSQKWLERVREFAPQDCVLALVENKSDLLIGSGSDAVLDSQGVNFAKKHAVNIFGRVSAKSGSGVEEIVQELLLAIYLKQKAQPRPRRKSSVVRRRDFDS